MSGRRNRLRELAFAAVAALAGFLLFEGASSVALFVREGLAEGQILSAEESHSRFDSELGWVNRPDVHVADMYGPGISLSTNSSGFRGSTETAERVPAGRVRIVCSGDSFTLGWGVSDDETWPELLEEIDARIEAVNMGQGGYGLDQAWLWYERDGAELEHQLHVVAFITDDFTRMKRTRSAGYAKPKLGLVDGRLVTTNLPLRRTSKLRILWAQNAHLITKLRTVALFRAIFGLDGPARSRAAGDAVSSPDELGPVVLRLFEDLARRNAAADRSLLCVYLPTAHDYGGSRGTDRWRAFLAAELASRDIPLLDLVPPFRALPYDDAADLFLAARNTRDLADGGHYTARGCRFVAERIYGEMKENRALATGLDRPGEG